MAGSINKAILIGNVGADPEVKQLPNGNSVANFNLATSETWKDKDGQRQEKTSWHSIVVFGPLCKVVEGYVKKGSKLYIEGAMHTRKWQDKDGQDRYKTEVVLQGYGCALTLLDSPSGGERRAAPRSEPAGDTGRGKFADKGLDDEIPF